MKPASKVVDAQSAKVVSKSAVTSGDISDKVPVPEEALTGFFFIRSNKEDRSACCKRRACSELEASNVAKADDDEAEVFFSLGSPRSAEASPPADDEK